MHSPHFTQRAKKSVSGNAPGGLISAGFGLAGSKAGVALDTATETRPAPPASRMLRRPTETAALAGFAEKPKETASLGHSLVQVMQ
jgi:hypothetical protein